ncbi:MAG TPA: hypothetical protein VFM93_09370 [Candidatus Limnocylindria bacterium]|nr:hypothetical protein [Candidatus Limnocylindria bacterium]
MGHAPGGHPAEARVPGLTLRRLLGGIPPLRQGEGPQCSFPAALAIASKRDYGLARAGSGSEADADARATADLQSRYDWVMGASGAAFTTAVDAERWDPLAASPRDAATRGRAAAAAGVRLDEVAPPYDDEMRALVLDRIRESIDAGVPVIVRGIVGPPEYGLLVGYDGDALLARTYFDKGPEPTRLAADALAAEERGAPIFLDPAPPVDRTRAIAAGVGAGLDAGGATDAAMAAWAAALRDDERWKDQKHAGEAAFGDQAMRTILADQRQAAARFLRGIRGELPLRAQGDALRAAESYGRVAELAAKHGVGPFDAAAAMRFLDPGHRRGWANLLDQARKSEAEAREALASVRAAL